MTRSKNSHRGKHQRRSNCGCWLCSHDKRSCQKIKTEKKNRLRLETPFFMTDDIYDTIKENISVAMAEEYNHIKAKGKKLNDAGWDLNDKAYKIYQKAYKIGTKKRINMIKDWKVIKQNDKIYVRADGYFWLLNLDTIDIESYKSVFNDWRGELIEGNMEDVAKAAFKIVMHKLTSFFVIRDEVRKPLSLLSDEDKETVKAKLWEELDKLF